MDGATSSGKVSATASATSSATASATLSVKASATASATLSATLSATSSAIASAIASATESAKASAKASGTACSKVRDYAREQREKFTAVLEIVNYHFPEEAKEAQTICKATWESAVLLNTITYEFNYRVIVRSCIGNKYNCKTRIIKRFHHACAVGNLNEVESLIARGVDINLTDDKGNTPLMYASNSGAIEIVNYLCDNGAHLDSVNNNDRTALSIACFYGHDNVVSELLQRGADVHIAKPIFSALIRNSFFSLDDTQFSECRRIIVDMLIDHGVDLHVVNEDGVLPYLVALYESPLSALKVLEFTDLKETILPTACYLNREDVCDKLINQTESTEIFGQALIAACTPPHKKDYDRFFSDALFETYDDDFCYDDLLAMYVYSRDKEDEKNYWNIRIRIIKKLVKRGIKLDINIDAWNQWNEWKEESRSYIRLDIELKEEIEKILELLHIKLV